MDVASQAARPPLLVIVGPTASGKTALALRAAELLGGEIISADSQQVYQGMDIGTGKASAAERARVPHHLLDLVTPAQPMSAATWAAAADAAIADLAARGRRAIVAGGTGLYVRALLRGLFDGPSRDDALRTALYAEAAEGGGAALHARLAAVDPVSAARIRASDTVRVVRALEVHAATGIAMSAHQAAHAGGAPRYRSLTIGLSPPAAVRAARIDARVDAMMAAGLLDEVRALVAAGHADALALQAIGYRQLVQHLAGAIDLAEAVRQIKRDSRRYARRQLTWYRDDASVAWYASVDDVSDAALVELGRRLFGEGP